MSLDGIDLSSLKFDFDTAAHAQALVREELTETRKRLERWLYRELSHPCAAGEGRNNQMIKLTPRMLELGWDEEAILEKFNEIYELDGEKDDEIQKVIDNAVTYVTELRIEDPEEQKARKAQLENHQRSAAALLKRIMADFAWSAAEIQESGNVGHWTPLDQQVYFLSEMFQPSDVVWIGHVWSSGKEKHATNFRDQGRWLSHLQRSGEILPFEFVSHCTWQPGSFERTNANLVQRRYIVVESDSLTMDQTGAVLNWMCSEMEATLRAVVFSGRRSIHGWFDWPEQVDIKELSATLRGLQCDPSVLRAPQPVRLPGAMRRDTGTTQTLLYLNTNR